MRGRTFRGTGYARTPLCEECVRAFFMCVARDDNRTLDLTTLR